MGTAVGDYTLTYTATGADGNTATATRLVHVVPAIWTQAGDGVGPTAGVTWPNGAAYFMRGEEYLRYDVATDQVSDGYPVGISARWSEWPDGFVAQAAVKWNKDVAYFFSDTEYLRYDIAALATQNW